MKKYTSRYSPERQKWCVFERLTDSIMVVVNECEDEQAAEKLAARLNAEEIDDE